MKDLSIRLKSFIKSIADFCVSYYGWLLVILAPSILFMPMLLSGEVIFWGTPLLQFVPWREFAFDALRDGYFPLWNPWLGMGAPLIANYQSALFYPPNFLLILIGSAWGHGLLVFLHIVWTGIGMMLLARKLGLGKLSQAIAGLAFSLSGYVLARAGFLSINAAVSWLPWIILAAENLIERFDGDGNFLKLIKPSLMMSLLLSMQWFAGHAQTSWYCLLLLIIWMVWRSFDRGRLSLTIRTTIGLGVAIVTAFLLSAVQLLPTAEYLFHSHRATEVDTVLAFTYSFWPWRFLGLLMPNLFGNPATGEYWGYANFWEDAIYIGVLPLILAIFAVARGIRREKFSSLIALQIAFILSSALMALGKNTPIFPFFFKNVPTFDLFQAPTRWMVIFEFALVLLAAIGAELWQRQEVLRLFWVRLGTVGGLATLLFALIVGAIMPDVESSFSPVVAIAGAGIMISGALAWRRRLQPGVYWPAIITAFIAIDLIIAGRGLNPSLPKEIFEGKSELTEFVTQDERIYMSQEIEKQVKFDWTHRFDTFYPEVEWDLVRDSGLPNTTLLDRIPSANNFDPILPERYVIWMESIESLPESQLDQILRMMGVGWKATLNPMKTYRVLYEKVQNPSQFVVVGEAIWVEDPDRALQKTLHEDFNFQDVVVLEGPPTFREITRPELSEMVLDQNRNPNRLQIDLTVSEDCWLVISMTNYPGWHATIDGEDVQLYQANYVFNALRVPAGSHQVILKYQPSSFLVGVTLSVISWITLGVLWWKFGNE
jgi:hypothetical protein